MRRFFVFALIFLTFTVPSIAKAVEPDAEILLNKRVVRIDENGRMETLTRRIVQVKTRKGVEKFKTINIRIDPKRDRLKLLKAVRYEKQKEGPFQKDDESQAKVYPKDGRRTSQIYITMPIKKPGDKLEYEILIIREKPLLENHFWNMHNMNDVYPVKRAEFSVTLPKDRELFYQVEGGSEKPEISTDGKCRTYTWKTKNLQPVDDVNRIVISSTNSWDQIAKWLNAKYYGKTEQDSQAKEKAKLILRNSKCEEQNMEEAVHVLYQYVSNNIENTTIKDSSDLFVPKEIRKTLKDRKGDCKDKTILLISMLKAINIEAFPLITNTEMEIPLDEMLPTPYYFNHALVYVPEQQNIDEALFIDTAMRTYETENSLAKKGGFMGLLLKGGKTGNILKVVSKN